jgi:hypothetical protein
MTLHVNASAHVDETARKGGIESRIFVLLQSYKIRSCHNKQDVNKKAQVAM